MENEPQDEVSDKVVNPCDSVGIIHNQGLAYIYNGLKVMEYEEENILDSIYVLYIQFLEVEGFQISIEEAYYLYNLGLQNVEIDQDTSICLLDSTIANSDLTNAQKDYLYRLSNIVKLELPFSTIQDSISAIDSEVINDLSEEDQTIVLSSSSILLHSTEYWNDNYDDWEILFNSGSKDAANVVWKI